MGYTHLEYFIDDGVSGVTMDRPGFKAMMDELEKGYAQAVFVKDLSRLGRNYVEVGKLMDTFFPEHDIRLVAVSDAIDTFEGESEMAPIKNVFNEWYARDISKKRRISNKIKGNSGFPMGPPPYGYKKDPDDSKRWIIDEEAAVIVRPIYDMHLGGMGIEQIAARLERDEVLTPNAYWISCSNYKGNRGTCPSTHYIRADFLEEVVLGEIKRLTKYATAYEPQFAEAVMGYSQKNIASDRESLKKTLYAMQARDRELDVLFERIYEDNVAGKLSDERFARMSKKYDEEQKELAQKIRAARDAIDKSSAKEVTADMFISTVRKYTRAKKLTQRMVNELIDRIEVHQAEKVDGVWEQRLTIHYNCVGVIDIPEALPIPAPEVTMNTRKGVYVSYAATPAAS